MEIFNVDVINRQRVKLLATLEKQTFSFNGHIMHTYYYILSQFHEIELNHNHLIKLGTRNY